MYKLKTQQHTHTHNATVTKYFTHDSKRSKLHTTRHISSSQPFITALTIRK